MKLYPEKPKSMYYQNNCYGYEVPMFAGRWQWSDTFGSWSRYVILYNGWQGWSFACRYQ